MELKPPKGAVKNKKIKGRGHGSGRGGRAGKGDKGQNARSGGGVRPAFEGGQMPLYRRVARRGFSNMPFRKEYSIVNVGDIEKRFDVGEVVTKETLLEKGLIKKKRLPVKILGEGEFNKKLRFEIGKFTKSAEEKIKKAGGELAGGVVKTEDGAGTNGN